MEQILSSTPAVRIFDRLLRGFDAPPALRLWNDALHEPIGSTAVFTLVLRDPHLLRRLVFERNAVLLADAYFRGSLDVEGDFYAALQLKGHFASISLSWRDKLALLRDALRLPGSHETGFKPAGNIASRLARRFSHRHSRDSDSAAITFHYDVSNFEIHDVEGLRPHYALTLRHWVDRLEANREAALREVDEPTYRVWRLYMAACALEFESGGTGIYQILASRPDRGRWPVPLSRGDLHAARC